MSMTPVPKILSLEEMVENFRRFHLSEDAIQDLLFLRQNYYDQLKANNSIISSANKESIESSKKSS